MNKDSSSNIELKPSDLHGIFRYVKLFRKQTFVIGIESSLIESANLTDILKEITVYTPLRFKY